LLQQAGHKNSRKSNILFLRVLVAKRHYIEAFLHLVWKDVKAKLFELGSLRPALIYRKNPKWIVAMNKAKLLRLLSTDTVLKRGEKRVQIVANIDDFLSPFSRL
jgi:hypothetical protein